MRVRWSYCLGGIGLAAASFVIGLEVENATARTESVSTGSVSTTIDRSLKGDRLAPATGMRPSTSPSGQPKLPDDCESSVSTIRNRPVIERCFAAAPGSSVLG
jgi:hypothetical protein